jgi:hypothetical protein
MVVLGFLSCKQEVTTKQVETKVEETAVKPPVATKVEVSVWYRMMDGSCVKASEYSPNLNFSGGRDESALLTTLSVQIDRPINSPADVIEACRSIGWTHHVQDKVVGGKVVAATITIPINSSQSYSPTFYRGLESCREAVRNSEEKSRNDKEELNRKYN